MLVTLETWILSTESQSFHCDKQALEGYRGQPGQRGKEWGWRLETNGLFQALNHHTFVLCKNLLITSFGQPLSLCHYIHLHTGSSENV